VPPQAPWYAPNVTVPSESTRSEQEAEPLTSESVEDPSPQTESGGHTPIPATPPSNGRRVSPSESGRVPRPDLAVVDPSASGIYDKNGGEGIVGHLPPASEEVPVPAQAPGIPPAATSGSQSAPGPTIPGPPARVRYFEEATDLIVSTLDGVEGDGIIGWAHDRVDPDTMGANGLMWWLLRERYQKGYQCFYSKRMSFLMNRSLATNFMPSGVLTRCEATENLSEIAHKAPMIVVLDATSPEIMTDFAGLLRRSPTLKEKPILFVDHHRKGKSDIESLPNAQGVRYEQGQATSSILLHVLLNLGLDLRNDEEAFRLAVVTKAGIETDLIGVDPSGYADSTRAALDHLDEILGERGQQVLTKLSSIKHPLPWYRKLGQALAEVGDYDSTVAVAGLGVIGDTGIVPFVANRLMEMGPFKTTIVFAIVYEVLDGQIVSIDLDASGRSSQDTEIVLPDLFHEIFFVTGRDGKRTPKGGGRANKLLGDFSGAGASVPLHYWRHLGCRSSDEKKSVLERLAWPAEFLRLRHLITQRIPTIKSEEVRSVTPTPGLEAL
jgi:hypothetical protein